MVVVIIILCIVFSPVLLYALSFIVCCVMCLGYLCTTAQEYPMVKRLQEESAIVYNGEKYFYLDEEELSTNIYIRGETQQTASIYAPYVGIFPQIHPLETSEFDTEKNILVHNYSYRCWVKEDFRAIAEYDTQIIASVSVGYPETDGVITLSGLSDGLTYRDIVESEKTTLFVSYGMAYRASCYFDVAEYDYWRFGGFWMVESDGVMYLTMQNEYGEEGELGTGRYIHDCYRINAEYQEAFKTAYKAYTTQQAEAV